MNETSFTGTPERMLFMAFHFKSKYILRDHEIKLTVFSSRNIYFKDWIENY